MLKPKVRESLNKQVNAEFYAAYLYLSMSAWSDSVNLPGMAVWLKCQAQEETGHAMRIYDYIIERGDKVELRAIDKPPAKWETPQAAFEAALGHEQKVTGMINDLVNLTTQEGDHATTNMLQWFVAEQVEEEASADAIVQKIKRVQDSPGGLFMVDHELGQRGSSASSGSE